RTRIKLFYRPNDIQKLPRGAELLKWSMVRDGGQCQLVIENTSAYNINFASIDMMGENSEFGRALIAKPLETTQVPLGHCPVGAVSITPHVVNDYGVVESWPAVAPTLSGAPVTGVPAGAAQ
ncbi:MAG: molecular chaperone, partial [Corticimicrobacter sp.]